MTVWNELSTLSSAATGQVSLGCLLNISALLVDAGQSPRMVQVRVCNSGESKAVRLKADLL